MLKVNELKIKSKRNVGAFFRYKTIRIVMHLIGKKDRYTAEHCMQVMKLAVGFARYYGCPPAWVKRMQYAALLHDTGKLLIPARILKKPGILKKNEYEIIKMHPLVSAFLADHILLMHPEAAIIRHHHERIDGNGYPSGFKGNELDALPKILSVCDAFDAMTNNRIYRKKKSVEDALEELRKNAGSQFDVVITANFCEYVRKTKVSKIDVKKAEEADNNGLELMFSNWEQTAAMEETMAGIEESSVVEENTVIEKNGGIEKSGIIEEIAGICKIAGIGEELEKAVQQV